MMEVPEDSNDARVWVASQTANPPNVIASPMLSTSVPEACSHSPFHPSTSAQSPSSPALPIRSTPTTSTSVAISGITPKTTTTGPKKAGGLSALLTSRPKKISALEKSRLDWNEHISSESTDVKSELEANRRGGGFLAKMDFLGRVEGRRENIDAAKGKRKR
ncbi:hypothetical protein BS47DRAFT_1342295 [Hydnum rufescens UP504]|uniref:SWR1-complex protein 5 n=1 Tax=Hydnum rufescens UP504 TaxID=1448309 RepID=A0A9P6B093_9AGAM|nr:hypothetical protein BS47DRAFT_1342295 [Hydnum rufescens UP504]